MNWCAGLAGPDPNSLTCLLTLALRMDPSFLIQVMLNTLPFSILIKLSNLFLFIVCFSSMVCGYILLIIFGVDIMKLSIC